MGKMIHQEKIDKMFKKSPVIDFSSIERLVNSKKKDSGYARLLLKNLIDKGKIIRLSKGHYTIHKDPALSVFSFSPSYLGLEDALSLHNISEQETVPIIITTRKVRQGKRTIASSNIIVHRIDKRYFFGFDHILVGDFYLPVSDKEKTMIDLIYYRRSLDTEVIKNMKKVLQKTRLQKYLSVYPKSFRTKVKKILFL